MDVEKPKIKILAIDDEPSIRDFLIVVLEDRYQVVTAGSGIEGIRLALSEKPQLILLDILMPGDDGIACLQELRANYETARLPIIMLTAADYSAMRIQAFNAGADDFVTKPFRPAELIARIESKLERMSEYAKVTPLTLQMADLKMDLAAVRVHAGREELSLGAVEFKILSMLLRRKGALIRREELEAFVWSKQLPSDRALDPHISSLRRKLQRSSVKLQTIYGAGYSLTITHDAIR